MNQPLFKDDDEASSEVKHGDKVNDKHKDSFEVTDVATLRTSSERSHHTQTSLLSFAEAFGSKILVGYGAECDDSWYS